MGWYLVLAWPLRYGYALRISDLSAKILSQPPVPANGTLSGIFLGDELCCEDMPTRTGMECWESVIAPVADKLRAMLGSKALIYTNECGKNWTAVIDRLPPDLDLISIDTYCGYTPSKPGTAEVARARDVAEWRQRGASGAEAAARRLQGARSRVAQLSRVARGRVVAL